MQLNQNVSKPWLFNKEWIDFYEQLSVYQDLSNKMPSHICNDETILRNPVIERTMNFTFYPRQLEELSSLVKLDDKVKILEVGGGIGGLAKMITQKYDVKTYTMIDHANMLKLAKINLAGNDNMKFIEADNIENIVDNYELFISIHCLTETPIEYQQYVYKRLFSICEQCFIIDGEKKQEFNVRLFEALNNHFSYIEVTKWPDYPNSKRFYAKKSKESD